MDEDTENGATLLDDSTERADILSDGVMERGIAYQMTKCKGGLAFGPNQSQSRFWVT